LVNIALLREKIDNCGMSMTEVARRLNIDPSTLYRKFEREGETFTVKQAGELAEMLGLAAVDAQSIFFSRQLA
jgi:ribosome-binding protein aMBF1 (putative translation factor)